MRALRFVLMGSSVLVLVGMVLHIVLDIVLRAVFSTSTFIADEYVGYGLAFITFVPIAIVFLEGAMLKVDLLKARPGSAAGRVLMIANLLALGAVAGFVLYAFFDLTRRNFLRGTISQTIAATPLWIPMSLAVVGFAGLLVAIAVRIFGTWTASSEELDADIPPAMNLE